MQTVSPQQAAALALELPAKCQYLSWPDEKLLGAEPLADMLPLHLGDGHAPHAAADVALSYMHPYLFDETELMRLNRSCSAVHIGQHLLMMPSVQFLCRGRIVA